MVGSHTVGNWLNIYSSIENIKRDEKEIQTLSESHTNPNLGVTMRGKDRLVITDSRIVVFWYKEVKKGSAYDSEGSNSTPIFSNKTLSDGVVHGVDFSQGIQSKMQKGAITLSTKENPNIKKKR